MYLTIKRGWLSCLGNSSTKAWTQQKVSNCQTSRKGKRHNDHELITFPSNKRSCNVLLFSLLYATYMQTLSAHLPVPLSMKTTLEMGRKLVPLSSSSSPPSTEQAVRLTDSMMGSSCAERWAAGCGNIHLQKKILNKVFKKAHLSAVNKDHSQHSMGKEATCRANSRPAGATGAATGKWVRKTRRTRVFFLPTSVSPFLSSMSEFLSLRMPAQSILAHTHSFILRVHEATFSSVDCCKMFVLSSIRYLSFNLVKKHLIIRNCSILIFTW